MSPYNHRDNHRHGGHGNNRRGSGNEPVQGVAAVPKIVQSAVTVEQLTPGHKFYLYWSGWHSGNYDKIKVNNEELKKVGKFPGFSIEQIQNLIARQETLADNNALRIQTTASAPFTTGLGEEHPLENGFAFLSPYGIPYYPGSGIKGAVRKAAEILALTGQDNWSIPLVWWVFGFDANAAYLSMNSQDAKWLTAYKKHMSSLNSDAQALLESFVELVNFALRPEHKLTTELVCDLENNFKTLMPNINLRGSVNFWDCFPIPPDHDMRVDIMNPHQSGYYQSAKEPGTWGNPVPIYFLTLPAGTIFKYFVTLMPVAKLPESVQKSWQTLLTSAFRYAFEIQGGGAKTASGYGVQTIYSESNGGNTSDSKQETTKTSAPAIPKETPVEAMEKRVVVIMESVLKGNWGQRDSAVRSLKEMKDLDGDVTIHVQRLVAGYRKKFKKKPEKIEKFQELLTKLGLLRQEDKNV